MNKTTFEGFETPGTTPVPDIVFDELLSELTGNELKVLLYIIRRTYGFGKNADAISLSQFRKGITTKDEKVLDKGCGIEHNRTILVALASLENKGYVIANKRQTKIGDADTTIYKLRFKGASKAVSSDRVVTSGNDVVTLGNDGSYPTSPRLLPQVTTVVTSGNQQETVSQDTELQEKVIPEESIAANIDTSTVASNGRQHASHLLDDTESQSGISEAMIRETLEGQPEELIQRTIDAFKQAVLVHRESESPRRQEDMDESLIAASLSRDNSTTNLEGEHTDANDTTSHSSDSVVDNVVGTCRLAMGQAKQVATHPEPAPCEAGQDSDRLQESEEGEPYDSHDPHRRNSPSNSRGDTGIPADSASCSVDSEQALHPQVQATEGEIGHVHHPHSHPSGSNSLGAGLEGAESPGQDGTIPTGDPGERALAEGGVSDGVVGMDTAHPGHPLSDGSALDRVWAGVCEDENGQEQEGEHDGYKDHHHGTDGSVSDLAGVHIVQEIDDPDAPLSRIPAITPQGDDHASTGLPVSGNNRDAQHGLGLDISQTEAASQAHPVTQQTSSRGGLTVARPLPEPSTVEPGRDVVGVAPVAPVPADTPSTTLPAQALPPSPEQAALGQAGMDERATGQEGKKPEKGKRQVKTVPSGPPVMPPDDAPWCAETIVQIMEARRGRRYPNGAKRKSDRERDVQLEFAAEIVKMEDIDREKLIRAATQQETRHNNWWMDTNGYITPRQLVEKDRIHNMLDELERLERKKGLRLVSQNGAANGTKPVVTSGPTTNIRELVRQREAARAAQIQ